jgi:tyrosine-protein kinase Etk/Wzc
MPTPVRSFLMSETKKIGFLDLLIIILARKWFVIAGTVLFTIAGFTLSSVMTKYYSATATILKPKQKMSGGLSSLLNELPVSGMMKNFDFSGQNDVDQFLNILQSRRLADKVIERFNLVHRYKFDKRQKYYYESVIKEFHKGMQIVENKYENVEISFIDSNPEFAADVANYIVTQLDTINFSLARESARNSREFFAERLDLIKADLDSASQRFAQYQEDHTYIDLEQQVKSSIDALAQIEGDKMGIDLEIQQSRNQFGDNSQRIRELLENKKMLEQHLQRFLKKGDNGLIVPLTKAPKEAIKYKYLYRDVKIQESLFQFVLQLFEQAKFTEANNVPTVQVLEWAKPPQMKLRPKRAVFMTLFFFIGFSVCTIYVLLDTWYSKEKTGKTDMYDKISQVLHLLIKIR